MISVPSGPTAPAQTVRGRTLTVLARFRKDIAALAILGVGTLAVVFVGARRIDPAAFEPRNFDVYIQGDLPRTYEQTTTRHNSGDRTGVHPLYPLAVHPITQAIHVLVGLSLLDAARGTVAVIAAGWVLALFLACRAMRLGRVDALLMSGVGLAGASAIFWLVVPETFVPGGVALLTALLVAARSEERNVGDGWYIASGVATFGTTLTNWATGVLLAATTWDWRRCLRICLQVVGATALLWIVEKLAFPNVQFIFDRYGVRQNTHPLDVGRLAAVSRVFFFHTAVAPRLEACHNLESATTPLLLSFQNATIGSGGFVGLAGTAIWLAMLALGAYALLYLKVDAKTRIVLAGTLAFQYALHLTYGGETFLYSIHWWAFLVLAAALALRTRARPAVRLLSVAFICVAGPHNWRTWESTLPVFRSGVTGFPLNNRNCVP